MLPVRLYFFTLLICSLLLLVSKIGWAQFAHPLDIQPDFSGTFAELRANHFHSGLDYKTLGKEGIPVKAAADGWVSRLKTSYTGFGKVAYLDHADGFTTVYAHLHSFIPLLSNYLDSARLDLHQNEIELWPNSGRFFIQKGDTIGWSGNTGSSQGPHLHFEIRDRISQEPLNPLKFLSYTDTFHPVIDTLIFYTKHHSAEAYRRLEVHIAGKDCMGIPEDTVYAEIFTYDPSGKNANGIYRISVQVNDSIVFRQEFNRFNFDDTRYANAKGLSQSASRSPAVPYILFPLPGDASAEKTSTGSGRIVLNRGDTQHVKINVYDYYGNCTERTLNVHYTEDGALLKEENTPADTPIHSWKNPVFYNYRNDTVFSLPAGALYQDTPLKSPDFCSHKGGISLLAGIVPGFPFAFHKAGKLRLPVVTKVDPKKIIVQRFDQPNDSLPAEYMPAGAFDSLNNFATASIRKGSYYQFGLDTIAPEISTLSEWTDPVDAQRFLRVHVKDAHSGVGGIQSFMNGAWIINEYDPKSNSVLIPLQQGTQCPRTLKVDIEDRCGNKSQLFHYF